MSNQTNSPKNRLTRGNLLLASSGILLFTAAILLLECKQPSPLTQEPPPAIEELNDTSSPVIEMLRYNERIFLPLDESGNLKKTVLFDSIGFGQLLNIICDFTFNQCVLRDSIELKHSPIPLTIMGDPGEAWFIFHHLYRTNFKTEINSNYFMIEIESPDSIPVREITPLDQI